VAKQLDAAYAFVTRQITLANVTGKREHIENAVTVLEQLRDAWRQIVKESRSQNSVTLAG
jgi:flagellin-specific chaperone FliS